MARLEVVSRLRTSATRKSAYNGREAVSDERTGDVYDFSSREAPAHHAVLLPDAAPAEYNDPAFLWNAVEAAERRKDSQVAREVVLALPADAEVTHEDRVALATSFARENFVSKGLAVQLDIHAPEDGNMDREDANWHAHLLITTRRLGPDGLSRLKARDLDPVVRRGRVVDGVLWGEEWRAHQDRYFREHGFSVRVAPNGIVSEIHVGPQRMRREGSEPARRLEALREANRTATYDPSEVLQALTRNNATFSKGDLERFLVKQLGRGGAWGEERAMARAAVMASPDVIALHDPDTGDASQRFTTRQVRDEERAVLDVAAALDKRKTGGTSLRGIEQVKAHWSLRRDQDEAFDYATDDGRLKLIAGRAGTGKSYTLNAIRHAHERDGKRVIGLAPTNTVAQDMKGDGFSKASTVHAALFALKNDRMAWDHKTVVMVDEAAMLNTAILREVMDEANRAGAKLILVGDDRQLASIERGGMFPELLQRQGWAELTEVRRQKTDWQRQAARDLAEYRFDKAVQAFDSAGAISWNGTRNQACDALVDAWKHDHEIRPEESRFVFAYTNKDVDKLNAQLRAVCRERGRLQGPDTVFEVAHRAAQPGESEVLHRALFAVGDRVQFTKTSKEQRIYNGNVGTIVSLDPQTRAITARLDAAANSEGRVVSWNAYDFNGFRHGYAGTIYKGQGKTLDRTYLYHTGHWQAASSYVALTRQRKGAAIFVAREVARNQQQLAGQMARQDERSASVAWASEGDVARMTAQKQAHKKEVLQPVIKIEQGESASGNAIGAEGTGAVGAARDVAAGRARFLEKVEDRKEKKRSAVERIQARRFIQTWNQRIKAFRAAQESSGEAPVGYEEARGRLLDIAKPLTEQPALAAAIHEIASGSEVTERAALDRVLDHKKPDKAVAELVAAAEQERHEGVTSLQRDAPAPQDRSTPDQRNTRNQSESVEPSKGEAKDYKERSQSIEPDPKDPPRRKRDRTRGR